MSRQSKEIMQSGLAFHAVWSLDINSSRDDIVDLFLRALIWTHGNILCSSAAFIIRFASTFSTTLVIEFSKAIGR
ncbi:hypothetical protein HI914_05286 [Erysiphe necator]|nr:hypothetical protein HI914_05286 [Erysiphe necator]